MTLANHADGTATGTIADDHGVDVPVKIAQDGARVTIEIPAAHSTVYRDAQRGCDGD